MNIAMNIAMNIGMKIGVIPSPPIRLSAAPAGGV